MIIPTNWADPTQYDECVLFSTPVGTNTAGRGGAGHRDRLGSIEGTAGYVWVGIFRDAQVHKLDTVNGQPMPVNAAGDMTVDLSWGPYGAIVDSPAAPVGW